MSDIANPVVTEIVPQPAMPMSTGEPITDPINDPSNYTDRVITAENIHEILSGTIYVPKTSTPAPVVSATPTPTAPIVNNPVAAPVAPVVNPSAPNVPPPAPVAPSNPTGNEAGAVPVSADVAALQAELNAVKRQLELKEEYERDPLAYRAKYEPGVILENFDRSAFLKAKLEEKYGVDFVYKADEMWLPGTRSFEYREDVERFAKDADNIIAKAKESQQSADNAGTEFFNVFKEGVKAKYSLNDAQFESDIMGALEGKTVEDGYMLIVEGIMAKRELAALKNSLATNTAVIENRPMSPSAMVSNADIPVAPEQKTTYQNVFDPARVNRAFGQDVVRPN